MDSRSMTLQIRKLRKKIRQIENLESLDRDLNDEEISKCLRKDGLREELLFLLSQINEGDNVKVDEDFNSSCSVSTDWSMSTSKSASESDINVIVKQNENGQTSVSETNVEETKPVDAKTDEDNIKPSAQERAPGVDIREGKKETKGLSSSTKKGKNTLTNKGTIKVQNSKLEFWNNSGFIVTLLEGHNDLVTAVDCNGTLFVSASRDTTVKVWDMTTLTEKRSLGSHTGSVTDVVLLSYRDIGPLGEKLGLSNNDCLVLSGSLDCSLKLWSAETGELLKSIYTYNPITKVTFHATLGCAVTASDGGKIELWDLDTKDNITSHKAHEDSITGLVVKYGKIFTSCAADGEIKVFEVRENNLNCLFVSENIHTVSGKTVILRHIRALNVKGVQVLYGDDGVNVKCLSWKKGLVKKVPNHKEDFGMTDAICVNQDTMVTSAYDLDTGYGYLNVFDVTSDPSYLTTINSEECGRILDVTCCHSDGQYVTIVTAGTELNVWRQVPKSSESPDMIPTKYEQVLSQAAIDSDLESDVEFSESDSEHGPSGSRRSSIHGNTTSSWTSWCNIV